MSAAAANIDTGYFEILKSVNMTPDVIGNANDNWWGAALQLVPLLQRKELLNFVSEGKGLTAFNQDLSVAAGLKKNAMGVISNNISKIMKFKDAFRNINLKDASVYNVTSVFKSAKDNAKDGKLTDKGIVKAVADAVAKGTLEKTPDVDQVEEIEMQLKFADKIKIPGVAAAATAADTASKTPNQKVSSASTSGNSLSTPDSSMQTTGGSDKKEAILAAFKETYQQLHGKAPQITEASGWFTVDDNKLRLAGLESLTTEMIKDAKTKADKAKKQADANAKAARDAEAKKKRDAEAIQKREAADAKKKATIEEFLVAYKLVHERDADVQEASGWFSINGAKKVRLAALKKQTAELNKLAKAKAEETKEPTVPEQAQEVDTPKPATPAPMVESTTEEQTIDNETNPINIELVKVFSELSIEQRSLVIKLACLMNGDHQIQMLKSLDSATAATLLETVALFK